MESGTNCIMINRNWTSKKDRPCLNQWYPCKTRDDWYKIVIQERTGGKTIYKVVSYREGKDKFFGLTLAQARSVIQIETYKFNI